MVESEFILLGTDRDATGVPWALLASDHDGELKFAGPDSGKAQDSRGAAPEGNDT